MSEQMPRIRSITAIPNCVEDAVSDGIGLSVCRTPTSIIARLGTIEASGPTVKDALSNLELALLDSSRKGDE